jgi:hypothetical protein
MSHQQNDLSLDNVAGYQKQAYWHVVAVAASLDYVIRTMRIDPILGWAARKLFRYPTGPLGPNPSDDVEDDQLLLLLEHTPPLILEVNRRLTWSKAHELAPRVKSPTYCHNPAHAERWGWAVEWARSITANKGEVPEYSSPKGDGASPEGKLGRLKKLSEAMGVDFVRRVSAFIIQLDAFVELCHNLPPTAPIPESDKLFEWWKNGGFGQKLHLEESLVVWAVWAADVEH